MSDYISESTGSYQPSYVGRFWRLFWLAFGQVLLTIATLGVGRFWMVTNLRRYYWSSIEIDGEPLEYTGRPLEKLIGFLFAVVILAVYLAAVNLALAYIGLSYFQGDPWALNISILALIPLGFWAQYRARRYILARTRWRGIRFGVAPGAWGYMIRALGWWMATILSFGLLYPMMQMDLARYTTNRTFFGDLRFRQEGGVGPLMLSWLWVWLPIAALAAFAAANWADMKTMAGAVDLGEAGGAGGAFEASPAARTIGLLLLPASIWLIVGYIRHSIFSFRYLNSNRVLGDATRFTVTLGFWTVVWIYIAGSILMGLVMSVVAAVVAGFGAGAMMAVGGLASLESLGDFEANAADPAMIAGLAMGLVMYVGLILFVLVLTHVFITQPLLRATCRSARIRGLTYATRARQREHDRQSEAGGFADALGADVGGAF